MDTVSDIDMNWDGTKFGIEWESEDGFRNWEWFNTAEERNDALMNHYRTEEKA